MLIHTYLQVALYKNKIPKSIYEVETGKACNCNCPICGSDLEAKNSGKEWNKPLKKGQRIAHFAHSDGSDCAGATESMLHKIAKEVLKETLTLKLPGLWYKNVNLLKSKTFKFFECQLEQRVNVDSSYIQPDAILIKKNTELFIEFYKTHFVDDSKIEKIKKLNKSTIEIDLNYIPILKDGKINREEIKENLINNVSNRQWLYNRQIDSLYKEYIENLSKDEQKEEIAKNDDEQDLSDDNHSMNYFYQRGIESEERLYKWKKDLLKKGYKFIKIYKYPTYDWDGKRKYFDGLAEKIYCPKKKHKKETVDLFDCKRCEYYGKMIKDDDEEWRVVCKFSIGKFLEKDKELVKKLNGEELLRYCFEVKYPLIDNSYVQTLITIYTQIGEDMFPLLEEAETENKRLSIVDDSDLEIKNQYFIEKIKIV